MLKITRTKSGLAWLVTAVLLLTTAVSAVAAGYPTASDRGVQPAAFQGAYIIDAGAVTGTATTQTIAQGIKPYGLIYALVKAKVPVQWIINPNKTDANGTVITAVDQTLGNNGTDFTFDCDGSGAGVAKKYRTGAFVIPKEFTQQAASIVSTWQAKGVVVDGPCSADTGNLPVYGTIAGWPKAILDAQNGSVAVAYFNNAEIPAPPTTIDPANPPAYRFAAPSQLTACDDIYVMPHADPTWATHKELLPFVNAGGSFYASCHAVSEVENMENPANPGVKVMNFLTTGGMIHYSQHSQGSIPYSFFKSSTDSTAWKNSASNNVDPLKPGDPVAQFLGTTDAATQAGSEQIFIPKSGSAYRPTTQLITYDPTWTNSSTGGAATATSGPASSLMYGPAFGDKGLVMYEGGHSVNKGTAGDVAAQRAFFNFLLLSAVDRRLNQSTDVSRSPQVSVLEPAAGTAIQGGQSVNVRGAATGGSGSYTYTWSAACYDTATGAAVSTPDTLFANKNAPATTFTAPGSNTSVSCNMTLTVIDTCGRYSFGYSSVIFSPAADVQVTQTQSLNTTGVGGTVTYTIEVKNNGGPAGANNTATGVKLIDKVPSGFEWVSTTPPAGVTCTSSNAAINCDIGSLAKNATATITITLRVLAGQGGATLTNSPSASSTSADQTPSNNTDSDSLLVSASGVAIEITADTNQVNAATGGPVTFTYKVTNPSTGTYATNGLTIGSVTDNNGTPTDSSDDISLVYISGDTDTDTKLDTGETWIYRMNATLSSSSVTITSASGDDGNPDSNSATKRRVANVVATDSILVSVNASNDAVVQLVTPSLEATKTADSSKVASGGTAYFTLQVKNTSNGPATFRNIALSDTFSGAGTLSCASGGSDLVVTTSGQTSTIKESAGVAYAIASLDQGAVWTARCKVTGVTVTSPATTATNTITATSANPLSGGSGNITNTSPPATITIAPPVFAINKKADLTSARPGKALNYLIEITNQSASTQSHVKVTDPIPAGLTLPTTDPDKQVTVSKNSTIGAATAQIGVLANDKFFSNSTSGGTGWTNNWTGSNATLNSSSYALLSVPSTATQIASIARSVNFNENKKNSYILFECWASDAAQKTQVFFGTTSLYNDACGTSRKMISVAIPNNLLPSGTGNTATEIKISSTSTGSSKSVYIDDVSVVSGLLAAHNFGNLTSSSFSTSNDGIGFATAWTRGGTKTTNIYPYSSSSSKGRGTSVYWKSGQGSTDTGNITRNLNLSSADFASAAIAFSCKADKQSGFDSLKIYVGSDLLFTETSSTSYCNNTSSSSGDFYAVSPITIPAGDFGDNVALKIEFKGSRSAYLDDLVILGQVKGSGATTVVTYPSLSAALAVEQTLAAGEKITISYKASVMMPYPNLTDTDVLNTASVCVVVSSACTETSSSTSAVGLSIAGYKVTKTVSAPVIQKGSSVTYTYNVISTGSSKIANLTLVDDLGSGVTPTYVSGDLTGGATPGRDNVLDPGEIWVFTYTSTNVQATQNGTATLDGEEVALEENFDANGISLGTFSTVYIPLDSADASKQVRVVDPQLVIAAWVNRATGSHTLTASVRTGSPVTFKFTATTGNATSLKNVTLTNKLCLAVTFVDGDTNNDGILQQSETWNFTCTSAPVSSSQVESAGIKGSATDTEAGFVTEPTPLAYNITVIQPVYLAVAKTATQTNAAVAGSSSITGSTLTTVASNSVRYSYHVTSNNGSGSAAGSSVATVAVTDDGCSPITAVLASGQTYNLGDLDGDSQLDPNEDWEFECNAGEIQSTSSSNSSANAVDETGGIVTSPYVTYHVIVQKPSLRLEVKSNKEYAKYGSSVTYTYTVTNDGETNFTGSSVTPNGTCSPITQVLTSGHNAGDTNANGVLNPGEVWQYTCTQSNITTDTEEVFTVSVSGSSLTPVESRIKVFVFDPNLTVTQLASAIDPISNSVRQGPATTVDAKIGDTIKYDYTIASTATIHGSPITGLNVWLINSITDAKCDPITAVLDNAGHNAGDNGSGTAALDNNDQLDPGEAWQFTCSTTQLTQTAAVVDAAAVVAAATVAENYQITAPTARVRIAFATTNAPLGGGGTVVVQPNQPVTPTPTPTPTPSPTNEIVETNNQLVAKVYFTGDSPVLTSKTQATLATFAKKVKAVKKTAVIKIYGYVKRTADTSYDMRLAKARATNVMNRLKKLGVKGTYTVKAVGIAPQNNPTARRVEVVVTFKK